MSAAINVNFTLQQIATAAVAACALTWAVQTLAFDSGAVPAPETGDQTNAGPCRGGRTRRPKYYQVLTPRDAAIGRALAGDFGFAQLAVDVTTDNAGFTIVPADRVYSEWWIVSEIDVYSEILDLTNLHLFDFVLDVRSVSSPTGTPVATVSVQPNPGEYR